MSPLVRSVILMRYFARRRLRHSLYGHPPAGASDKAANNVAVTREDMQCLKNDWLTDNVGFKESLIWLDS
jgi:hypothetical protein